MQSMFMFRSFVLSMNLKKRVHLFLGHLVRLIYPGNGSFRLCCVQLSKKGSPKSEI